MDVRPGATPVRQKQYPVPWEARLGIQDHIRCLQDAEILNECQSPWNTLLFPVKKSGGNDYRPVQDLCTVNSAVITIHPVVPNPYTLLSLLPAQASWFTCLDLKDTFFCLQLSSTSQPLFAIEWEDPHTRRKTQLTWTQLPQGFKNSPILFGEALAVDLAAFPREPLNCTLLQYVEDLLLASPTQGDCWRGTKALLALLSTTGYKMSWKKAQICRQEVKYLAFVISKGHQALVHKRKQAIYSIPWPNTKKKVHEFLGAAGFCRIWIRGFSETAKPLFKATAASGKDPLECRPEQEKAFEEIQRLVTSAPALGLPDVMRDLNLFVHEKNHTALGVLTQTIGPWWCPVTYLSKRLDPVAAGWPPCLWALAATVVLVREADKPTLGTNINVKVPHAVTGMMNSQGHTWLTSSRMTHHQGLLCENPQVQLETVQLLNPTTFLPTEAGTRDHNYKEVIDEIYLTRLDLMDIPLWNPELELFTDGSSFIQEGQPKAGSAITTTDKIVKPGALPQGWSAQWAELWALAQALRHAKGKWVNLYTGSRNAFTTLHVHGAIYKERRLLTVGERRLKSKKKSFSC